MLDQSALLTWNTVNQSSKSVSLCCFPVAVVIVTVDLIQGQAVAATIIIPVGAESICWSRGLVGHTKLRAFPGRVDNDIFNLIPSAAVVATFTLAGCRIRA